MIYAFMSLLALSALLLTSCEEDGDGMQLETPNGEPEIRYIRTTNPNSTDSLLVAAELGSTIAIVGRNLGGTRQVWFNDQEALINPSWVTNTAIILAVPVKAPLDIQDKLYLITEKGDTLTHDFKVTIPAPSVVSAKNEWVQDGENLVINGDFFFEPLSVTFTGAGEGEIVSVTQNSIEVVVPEGATEGPVTVTTIFGVTESTFQLWDSRNIILNFDDLVANGWRIGMVANDNGPIDGNYLVVGGVIAANQRDEGPGAPGESPLAMEFWGGPAGRTENFYPYYANSYRDYVLKFEAKVNKWYGGYLNLCLSTPDHAGNNQEIWSNTLNARAIWGPWAEEGKEFSTDGSWITVVIPLTEFQYHMGSDDERGVFYTPGQKFIESAAGSFSTWFLGSPENEDNEVEFFIDNIRFVQP